MSEKNDSIQTKLDELAQLVAWFQSDEFDLEASLGKYEEAEKLAETIEKDLTTLKNDITVIKKKFDSE